MMAPGRLLAATSLYLTAASILTCCPSLCASEVCTLYGRITDTTGVPVVAASVRVVSENGDTMTVATNSSGEYRLSFPVHSEYLAEVRVSSVGFRTITNWIRLRPGLIRQDFASEPTAVQLRGIEVSSRTEPRDGILLVNGQQMTRAAMQSVLPTNPVAAVLTQQVSRIGSNHSSAFRVDGSAPQYLLNNVPLGTDPAHFTLFSHIPSMALDHLELSTHGMNPAYGSSAVVNLITPVEFERHRKGELTASLVEATARFAIGTEQVFSAGTIRRSVIDELGQSVNIGSSRQVIPTPTFQDVMVSSGIRLKSHTTLLFDSYYSWDDLEYPVGYETGNFVRKMVLSYQRASEQYAGLTLRSETGSIEVIATTSLMDSHRHYRAEAEGGSGPDDIYVNLTERSRAIRASIEARSSVSSLQLASGWQVSWSPYVSTDMTQREWNLLSPFANSNRFYYYQMELDSIYGRYHSSVELTNYSCYSSALWRYGRIRLFNGVRIEDFGSLSRSTTVASRHSVLFDAGRGVSINVMAGRYFETPLSGVLESYQVPIRQALPNMIPVRTTLLSASVTRLSFRFETTHKVITNVPSLIPDFLHIGSFDGQTYQLDPRFLMMHSTGRVVATSVYLGFQPEKPIWRNLLPYFSYAWSKSKKSESGLTVPYDLDARHRWTLQLDYSAGSKLGCGIRWQYHTGYPYPPYESNQFFWREAWYYNEKRSSENSLRFPVNSSVDLYASYRFNRLELFATITNITNRANAMIDSPSGYIYDAGLLPNLGLRYQF
ncbi:MAG: TonB-dependent receptor [Candidatus Zixiibacteriota bacterium]